MSKYSYLVLGITACLAVAIVGTNVMIGNISLLDSTQNVAGVSQNLDKSNNGKPPFPELNLSRSARGEEIISALGDKLPEVASWYRVSESELKKMLKDKSIHADKKGKLIFIDEDTITASEIASAGTGNITPDGQIPLEQTFYLHSKPGSSKTIYLDFTGHKFVVGKSAWTSSQTTDFDAPAMDMDGSPTTFNESERRLIQGTWMRIAEAYLAYDVDVTTEEPTMDKLERTSTSDNVFGNRILFTNPAGVLKEGVGGSSYLGVFDDVGEYNKIALAFVANLAYNDKYFGDAGAHEIGHSLGLYHDGISGGAVYYSGQGYWSPIMGMGYYTPLSQWSKGEYANPSNTQDDLQVMQTFGLSYRADDFGNSISTAGNATTLGNTLSTAGIIERTGDIDFFKFNTNAGDVSFSLTGSPLASTLDAELTLYSGSGQVLASQDIPGQLGATISAYVPAGTYYLSVRGVGYSNPLVDGYTNYASLGQYYVNGTIVGTNDNPPVASISANPTAGDLPLTVQFSSNGSYDPDGSAVSYYWQFGDNTGSTEPNPIKTFTSYGSFNTVLTVTDTTNLSSSKSIQITVANQAPVASFNTSYTSNNIPMNVSFDASASIDTDGNIVSYVWDFGDGSTANGISTSHTYTKAGVFIAKLTVIDNGGLTSTKSVQLTSVDPNVVNAPINLSASSGGKIKGQVTLKWSDQSTNETSFIVERSIAVKTGTPTYQVIKELPANTVTYSDPVSANTYNYRVKAYNSATGTYSAYSNIVQIRVR